MNLIIIITFNFISGAAVAHFIQDLMPDYWDYVFKTHNAIEADEKQTTWYEFEYIIYGIIFLFGYVFMLLILCGFIYKRIKKLIKRLKE